MTRKFKVFGLAAFALLALSVIGASAAQAEVQITTGLTGPPIVHTSAAVHAVQLNTTGNITDNSFKSTIGAFTCENATSTFTGNTTGTDKTLTITPSYKDCTTITSKDGFGTPVTFTMNTCDYVFNQPKTIAGTAEFEGTVALVCPVGAKVEIEVYASGTTTAHATKICTQSIIGQPALSKVKYKNTFPGGIKDDVDIELLLTNIPYTTAGLCGVSSGNATYTSSLTLTSTSDDVWISE